MALYISFSFFFKSTCYLAVAMQGGGLKCNDITNFSAPVGVTRKHVHQSQALPPIPPLQIGGG